VPSGFSLFAGDIRRRRGWSAPRASCAWLSRRAAVTSRRLRSPSSTRRSCARSCAPTARRRRA